MAERPVRHHLLTTQNSKTQHAADQVCLEGAALLSRERAFSNKYIEHNTHEGRTQDNKSHRHHL